MEQAALSLWYDEAAGDVTLAFGRPDASYEKLYVRELPLDSERDETLPSSGLIVDAFRVVTSKLASKNNFSPSEERLIPHLVACMRQTGFEMFERFSELTDHDFGTQDRRFRTEREELEEAMAAAKAADDRKLVRQKRRHLENLNRRAALSHMALHRLRIFRESQQQSWSELLGLDADLVSKTTELTGAEGDANDRRWHQHDIKEKNDKLRRVLKVEEKAYRGWFKDRDWDVLSCVALSDLLDAAKDSGLSRAQVKSRISKWETQMSGLLPGSRTEQSRDEEAKPLVTAQEAVLALMDQVVTTPWRESAMRYMTEQSRSLWRSVPMRRSDLTWRPRLPRLSALTLNPFGRASTVADSGRRLEGDAFKSITLQATEAAGPSSAPRLVRRDSQRGGGKRKSRAERRRAARVSTPALLPVPNSGPGEGASEPPAPGPVNTGISDDSDAEADDQVWHNLPDTLNSPVEGEDSVLGNSVSTLWFTPPSGSMILDPGTEREPMDETRTPHESGPIPSSAPRPMRVDSARSSHRQPTPPTQEVQLNDIHALTMSSEGPLGESGRELNLPLSPLERSAAVSADDHPGYRSASDVASTAGGNGLDTLRDSKPADWRAPTATEDAQSSPDGNQTDFIRPIHDANVAPDRPSVATPEADRAKQSVDPSTLILQQLLGSENQLQHTPRARRRNSAEALPGKGVCHTRYDLLTELSLEKGLDSKPASLKYGWSDTPLSVKACLEGWRDDASDEEETMSTKSEAV